MSTATVAPNGAQAEACSAPSELALAGARCFGLHNRRGDPYRIMTWASPAIAGAAPAPVLYMLDANASFLTAAEALRLRSERPEFSGVVPGLVVGIGYPTSQPFEMTRRSYDYTPPADTWLLPERPDGSDWPPMGGADEFLDFIETTLKPRIESDHSIDRNRQAIFGHSFGGLFVMHALFTRPASFQTYIAASPSIWLNDRFILREERTFAQSAVRPAGRQLLMAVGTTEQDASGINSENRALRRHAAFKRDNRMVDNARDLAARLSSLPPEQLDVRYQEFPGEDHISVLPAAISRAVGVAFARPDDQESQSA